MARLTQHRCNAIVQKLNNRPRKRLEFKSPKECLCGLLNVAVQS
jgi:IS30 family transposase